MRRRGKVIAVVLGLVVLLVVGGVVCGLYRGQTVSIDQSYNNQTVSLVKGDKLELTLPGNPSTGYSWSYAAAPDETVLKQEKQWIGEGSGMVGSPQDYHWVYLAAGAGETDIKLKYSRSWETRPPAKVYTVHVEVAPRSEKIKGALTFHLPFEN